MTTQKLSIREKLGFGLGDAASNVVFQLFIAYQLIFYTDTFGISAGAVGWLILIVRLFDAITDPIMGGIADRTNSKHGRYRPYLIWIAPFYGLFAVLAFTVPDFGDSGKLIYAYITYGLLMLCYTAINIPYSALGGVMTTDPQERASLQSYRFMLAMLGGALVVWALPKLVMYFGAGDAKSSYGYTMGMVVMAAMAILLFVGCFFTTKERADLSGSGDKKNIAQDLGYVFKNDQWRWIGLITLILLITVVIKGSATAYYVEYFLLKPEMTPTFLTSALLAGVLGAMFANWAIRYICKVQLMRLATLANIIVHAALFFVPSDQPYLALALSITASFFHMTITPILFSTVADTVSYGVKRYGHGAMGMAVAAHLFALKIGIALGGAINAWVLEWADYVPSAVQSAKTLDAIVFLYAMASALGGVLVLIFLMFYRLDKKWAMAEAAG